MPTMPGFHLKTPAHMGDFVQREILDPLDLNLTVAARVLRVPRHTLSALLNRRASLSPDMTLRIEEAFGVLTDTLKRMQNSYDIAKARSREGEFVVARDVGMAA